MIKDATHLRNARQSSKLLCQEFACPTVGKMSRNGIVVCSVMPRESMPLTRVAINHSVRLPRERGLNLRLRGPGNKLIFLSQMHQNGRAKPIDLSQVFFGIATVISDRGVDTRSSFARVTS